MSCILGTGGAQTPQVGVGPVAATDDRAVAPVLNYAWSKQPFDFAMNPWADGVLWPSSTGLGGGLQGYGGPQLDAGSQVQKWDVPASGWSDTGGQKQLTIVGQTIDQYGNALGSCVVKGYVTATNMYVGSVTSDTGGYYSLPTPNINTTQHYLVASKAGSPDVAGVTDNTLTPS